MKSDLLRHVLKRDNSAGEDSTRYTTRRHVLAVAATAGAGLGTVGVLRGDNHSEKYPSARNSGENDTKTTGVPRPIDGEATPLERAANAESDEETQDTDKTVLPADSPVIGANLNGRPHRLGNNLELIDASNTSWVRAFLDVRKKITSRIHPGNDPDIVALRRAARERNCKLVVSLKWDFKAHWGDKEPIRVPQPDSRYERDLCQCAQRYLRNIGAPVDIVVLGNEPMWETVAEDIKVDDPPIVEFTRRVKDYLVQHGDHGDPNYLVGALNRAHSDYTRKQQFRQLYRHMFDMVREDEDVDGVDLHVHYGEFAQAEAMVAIVREEVPDGMITATEFSPVWRYDRNKDTPITEFEACEQFAHEYDIPAGMTAVEYFEYAKRNPRPPEEVADFYDALPWYNVNHIEDMYDLFADYDVSIGTIGFVQSLGMRDEDWTTNWTPFHINFLFQPALIRTERGIENTAHRHYITAYRERAVRDQSGST